jgi:hypothetical protein
MQFLLNVNLNDSGSSVILNCASHYPTLGKETLVIVTAKLNVVTQNLKEYIYEFLFVEEYQDSAGVAVKRAIYFRYTTSDSTLVTKVVAIASTEMFLFIVFRSQKKYYFDFSAN